MSAARVQSAPPGTQAVVRAVRLLKAVAASVPGAGLGDLAEELSLSKPTVHRILAALESEGLVTREGSRFRLGAGVVTLGAQALAGSNLRALARTLLERLAASSGETATLEIPSGSFMLILDEVRGGQLVGAHAEIGTRWPMHATSTGKAYLAALPSADRAAFIRGKRRALTPATLVDDAEFRETLAQAANDGFALTQEELEAGYSAVAVVFKGPGGDPVGALSLGGPSERLDAERLRHLGAELRAAGEEMGRRLGWGVTSVDHRDTSAGARPNC